MFKTQSAVIQGFFFNFTLVDSKVIFTVLRTIELVEMLEKYKLIPKDIGSRVLELRKLPENIVNLIICQNVGIFFL